MKGDKLLLYEARVRTRQAVLAAAAGAMLVLAAVIQLSGQHAKVDELTTDLIVAHKRFPLDVVGSTINALGLLSVAATLSFLFGATRGRKPELNPAARIVAIVGGTLAALTGVAYAVLIAVKASQFVSHGSQTYEQAHHLTSGTLVLVLPFIGQAAALLLAIGFVLIALNAMRVGLLTRFMGYLGVFVGVLVIFPIGSPVPVVQGFWLFALAYLLSGRWPNGVPSSWRTGRAEPWPSQAQLRQQRPGGSAPRGEAKPSPKPPREAVGAASRSTRATTPKRKRKRRR